jgi:hypothetical protein
MPPRASSGGGGADQRPSHDPVQYHPSKHQQQEQYVGLFKGLGVSSRQPVCNRRNTDLKRLHFSTHFAIGCHKWDTKSQGPTAAHEAYTDPGCAYLRRDAPQKNASVVELRQGGYDGNTHFRTEQREQFADAGPQLRQRTCDPGASQVHLGDDKPELVSHSNAVHASAMEPDALDFEMMGYDINRSAGVGALLKTNNWPKPPRCNPINGGPRNPDAHDIHPDLNFGRVTANCSNIVHVPNVRDPILGHHMPKAHFQVPGHKSTFEVIAEHNATVPPLRSLASVRPHLDGPHTVR